MCKQIILFLIVLISFSCKTNKSPCCKSDIPSYSIKKIKQKEATPIISGQVTKYGQPVVNSSVQIILLNPNKGPDTLISYTDSLGFFKIKVQEGVYQIRVYNGDFFSKKIKKIKISINSEVNIKFCVTNHSEGMY